MKKKLAVAILGALMFSPVILPPNNFLPAPVVCAEVKTIEADGYYIMGDGTEENQAVAKERARADAKRAASEQACTFVESISEIKNNNLTRDEIYTISAAILKVISDPVNPEISGGSVMFHCHITVTVDTSNIEKFLQDRQKLNEATRQNNELRAEIERLQAEINNLNKKFATASAEEKKQINAEIKRNEENFTAAQWVEKGNDYYWSGNYNNAIECYNKAIALDSKNYSAWNKLGATYHAMDDYQKAIEYGNKAIYLNPKSESAWNNLGFAYESQGNLIKAIECYNNAIELNPKDDANCIYLGFSYELLGDYEKAVDYYKKAIELNPNNELAWNNLGYIYDTTLTKWDSAKAFECYIKVVELNPKNDAAWYNLGVLYYKLQNYTKAVECFNKAIELKPDNSRYKNSWEYYWARKEVK